MFGFVYEDSDVEINAIETYLQQNNINKINSGIMILSGGCTMFDISQYFKNLIALDTNENQIKLVTKKIDLIEKNNKIEYKYFLENIDMNFDKMFINIKNGESINKIFGRDNLIKNFGINAVENTSLDFINHFTKVYNSKSIYHDFIFNRNMNCKIKDYDKYVTNLDEIKKIKLLQDNMINFLYNIKDTYDFIQTSNITDWMNNDKFIELCVLLKQKLNKNGILIMRRMLSDNILNIQFPGCIQLYDKTNIYTECILWQNI